MVSPDNFNSTFLAIPILAYISPRGVLEQPNIYEATHGTHSILISSSPTVFTTEPTSPRN